MASACIRRQFQSPLNESADTITPVQVLRSVAAVESPAKTHCQGNPRGSRPPHQVEISETKEDLIHREGIMQLGEGYTDQAKSPLRRGSTAPPAIPTLFYNLTRHSLVRY